MSHKGPSHSFFKRWKKDTGGSIVQLYLFNAFPLLRDYGYFQYFATANKVQ